MMNRTVERPSSAAQLYESSRVMATDVPAALSSWVALLALWSSQEEIRLRVTLSDRDLLVSVADDPTLEHLRRRLTSELTPAEEGSPVVHRETGTQLSLSKTVDGGVLAVLCALDDATQATLDHMMQAWQVLVSSAASDPSLPMSRLELMNEADQAQVLSQFSEGESMPLDDALLHELFESRARQEPEAIALIDESGASSYGSLNARAEEIADLLISRGVLPNDLVAVCLERGRELVAALLGVLKAGAAYVPLDPDYPAQRVKYMLRDSAASVLLTQASVRAKQAFDHTDIVDVQGAKASHHPARPRITGRAPAYVIYTSGSTGTPKAAVNTHQGMLNRIRAQHLYEDFQSDDVCCLTTSVSFVDSVFEIFGTLAHGLKLVIVPLPVITDTRRFVDLIAAQGITRITTVPSLARALLRSHAAISRLRSLRSWTLSGEEVKADLVGKLQEHLPDCEFIVQYGSSEVSSDAAIFKAKSFKGARVPLGRPLPNVAIYLLDRHRRPVPIGATGEIYVGGVGVGLGYLNQPDLTNSRFSRDAFRGQVGARLYRMGDLGRWNADGTLQYLGRSDGLVKIRGLRVETGEIEAHLLRLQGIEDAVVVARDNETGDRHLVAYVAQGTRSATHGNVQPLEFGKRGLITLEMLRRHLRACVPDYMIPAAFVILDEFPKTPNGKVNRLALPDPGPEAYSTVAYVPTEGELETRVAEVWKRLLKVERIGRNDNFFERGGHSLSVVDLLDQLRAAGLYADARDIYERPVLMDFVAALSHSDASNRVPPNRILPGAQSITPEMIPLVKLEQQQIDDIVARVPGGTANLQDLYPLGPLQEGILFHHLLDSTDSQAYVLSVFWTLSSRERMRGLADAVQRVIDRHDVLRSAVLWERLPQPIQVVYRHAPIEMQSVELEPASDPQSSLCAMARAHEGSRMDLSRAPLARLYAAFDRRGESGYVLLRWHHIVGDDLSLELFIAEVDAFLEQRGDRLPEPSQYRNYIARAHSLAVSKDAASFFRTRLQGLGASTVPFGVTEASRDGSEVRAATKSLDAGLVKTLRAQSRRMGLSSATLMHAAWALVVSQTSAREDVVFGSVLHGRLGDASSTQQSIGLFINTLPLRIRLRDTSVSALVANTHRELVELLTQEQASLVLAQQSVAASISPLFTSLFNYRRRPESLPHTPPQGVRVLVIPNRTHYPLTVSVDDLGPTISITAQTAARIDPARVIEYLQTALTCLLTALRQSPSSPALDLCVIPQDELNLMIHSFNDTTKPYRWEGGIHRLVEEQAARTPQQSALMHEGRSLTYAELDRRSNEVASHLRAMGVGTNPDQLVATCLERGLDLVVCELAILKAGAAYVPLDPSQPSDRLRFMIADSRPMVVLTSQQCRDLLADVDVPTAIVGLDIPIEASGRPTSFDSVSADPRSLAYVIYTSGSTGVPKGVLVEHGGVMNFAQWHCQAFAIGEGTRCSQLAAVGFDASVWELWPPLSVGATVVIAPGTSSKDTGTLLDWWSGEDLHVSFLPTPVAERVFAEKLTNPHLRTLLVGGDTLRHRPKETAFDLVNNYGPTETTVVATSGLIKGADTILHLGKPIDNTQIYILNERHQPVPLGVAGELYIAGAGIARGYLNRPELTAERFRPVAIANVGMVKTYRTGDVARWLPNGTLQYLGRNDDQVKIRGYRIELGEIEAQLGRLNEVREALVIAKPHAGEEKRLIAYVVPQPQNDWPSLSVTLRERLSRVLPEYMMPSDFVLMREFPLTSNGKVDRAALPTASTNATSHVNRRSPETMIEKELADVWKDVLGVDAVALEDHFFQIGGHSLSAITLAGRVSEVFGLEVPLASVFKHPTLDSMARWIESLGTTRSPGAHSIALEEGTL